MSARAATVWCLWLAAAGCDAPQPDWDRMLRPEHVLPYQGSPYFSDGRAMRPPPPGVVARGAALKDTPEGSGARDGHYLQHIPISIARQDLARGRERFDIFCAACHGLRGDGDSAVAPNMALRKPPSLISDEVRAYPPGRVFAIITLGYGLMPTYAAELPIEDRWAVIAYLQALQLSQSTPLSALPPALREQAEPVLK